MKRKYFRGLITLAVITLTTACSKGFDDCHESMYLENKSASSIYYVSTLKDGFLNYDPSNPTHASDYKIDAGKTQKIRIGITLSCWEQVMENADGYVYIYIYDATKLETEGWNNTRDKPLKKYTLSSTQLNKTNWTVSYP